MSGYGAEDDPNYEKPPTQTFTASKTPSVMTKATPRTKGKGKQEFKSKPPAIPTRTSSKRGKRVAAVLGSSENQGDNLSELAVNQEMKWEDQRDLLNDNLEFSRKRLKPQASFASDYWFGRTEITQKLKLRNELNRKISLRDFQRETGGNEEDWANTMKAKDLMDEMHAHCLDEKLCLKQANRLKMDAESEDGARRRVFVKLFTTSHLGLNIKNTSNGKRDNGAQSKFRTDLFKISESRHPERKRDLVWCPITGSYHQELSMVAAHLFSYRHGQDTMDAIFGRSATSELFSPYNGILMSNQAESFFDKGYYVIVPQVSATPSSQEIKDWHKVEPKNYQIRVLEPDIRAMNQFIGETDRRWRDLDGQKVLFKGNFRPRARYLYFTYCMAILRKSWNKDKPTQALSDELGKPYWGTAGRYIKKNMLQGFVQELGYDYEALLEGAISDSSNEEEVGLAALEAANDQIKVSVKGEDGLSYEQGSGSEDEGESESD